MNGRVGTRGLRSAFGIALWCLVGVAGGLPLSAIGQDAPEKSAKPIRLVMRGKPGDLVVFKNDFRMAMDMKVSLGDQVIQTNKQSSSQSSTESLRLRSLLPQGNLLMEKRVTEKTEIEEKDGKKVSRPKAPESELLTFAPDSTVHSRKPLEAPTKPAKPGKKKVSGKKSVKAVTPPAVPKATEKNLDSEMTFAFPQKSLNVGDTWTGTVPMKEK